MPSLPSSPHAVLYQEGMVRFIRTADFDDFKRNLNFAGLPNPKPVVQVIGRYREILGNECDCIRRRIQIRCHLNFSGTVLVLSENLVAVTNIEYAPRAIAELVSKKLQLPEGSSDALVRLQIKFDIAKRVNGADKKVVFEEFQRKVFEILRRSPGLLQ